MRARSQDNVRREVSVYDAIAHLYDPWSRSVTEAVPFYVEETHGRWLEREPGIWERADWDEQARTLTLSVRDGDAQSTMQLAWLEPDEWRALLAEETFEIDACYGWFDRRRYSGGEDTIWVTSVRE